MGSKPIGRPRRHCIAPTPFGRWLDASTWSPRGLADELGVTIGRVYDWRSGRSRVPPEFARKLIKLSDGVLSFADILSTAVQPAARKKTP